MGITRAKTIVENVAHDLVRMRLTNKRTARNITKFLRSNDIDRVAVRVDEASAVEDGGCRKVDACKRKNFCACLR